MLSACLGVQIHLMDTLACYSSSHKMFLLIVAPACKELQVSLAFLNRGYGEQMLSCSTVLGVQPWLTDITACYSSSRTAALDKRCSCFLQLLLTDSPACYSSGYLKPQVISIPAASFSLR